MFQFSQETEVFKFYMTICCLLPYGVYEEDDSGSSSEGTMSEGSCFSQGVSKSS